MLPSDNIFDSPGGDRRLQRPRPPPGHHQMTIRATDAKGNPAFESVFVTVQGPAAAK